LWDSHGTCQRQSHPDGLDRAEVLIDTREAEGRLGAADLWFLADRLAKHRHAVGWLSGEEA
jgi:hypothetical protein